MNNRITRRRFSKTLTAGTLGLLAGCQFNSRFDIIIKNGTIIDGTGKPKFRTDIGISNDRIVALENLEHATAKRIIDADRLMVAPGFIDIHTHTDLELLVDHRAQSKILQGVTTEVSGNCGYSPFPLNKKDFEDLKTNASQQYGLTIDWSDINGFLSALDKQKPSINYATFTGHGNLRSYVVGKNDVSARQEQIRKMQSILAESMRNGSLGLSTGLEYAPGSYASTEELIALNEVVAQHNGVYATHIRNEDDRVEEAVAEAIRICRETNVSLQISHLKACNPDNWHKIDHLLQMVDEAVDRGLPVKADRYPYIAYGTGLSIFLPVWSRQGDTEDQIARLSTSSKLSEIEAHVLSRGKRIGGWDRVLISSCMTGANKSLEGKTIAEAATERNQEPFAFIRQLLIDERMRVQIVGFAMEESNLRKVLSSPHVMIGSDGNAVAPAGKLGDGKPHPRFYGTFPRVLAKYVRDTELFNFPTAVKKMTSMPADKLGLSKRGRISKNYFADLVLFDPQTVSDKATFVNPHQFSTGIEYVIVNGQIVVNKGKHTGKKAGRVLTRRI